MKITRKRTIIISVIAVLLIAGVIFLPAGKNVLNAENGGNPKATNKETAAIANEDESEADTEKPALSTPDLLTSVPDKSVYMDATRDTDERIDALLKQMSLREKAAQMVQPEQAGISLSQITKYDVGSVLSGGGSAPNTGNKAENWNRYLTGIKEESAKSRLGIPVLYGIDAVHGNNNISDAVVFPHNIGLGAADDEELMTQIGQVTASEVRAIACPWTFAPCVGNAQNELWGRTYECYSEEADTVSRLSVALLKGLQGEEGTEEYLDGNHVLATAKHYIGEGYTKNGVNQGNVEMSEDEWEKLLRDELIKPYKALVDAGVMTLMPSYHSVNGVKCHENAYLINDVLKGDLGFTGLVVSDYNAIEQIKAGSLKEQVIISVNAGVDLLMEPFNWEKCIEYIMEAAHEGKISEERIDDAVTRILRVKFMAGLFDEESGSETEKNAAENFGSDAHRQVARRAARESVTLLTNGKTGDLTAMETLKNAKSIMVAGGKADDIGAQCGGWTISWQGSNGQITKGTTLLEALKNAGLDISYTPNGDGLAGENASDAYIVTAGENPDAESMGDRGPSSLTLSDSDVAMLDKIKEDVKRLRSEGKPVILLLFTGRPVNIADYIDEFDAIAECWLPGTEGDGLADVLVGDYDFTGTTTFTWPVDASYIDKKFEDDSLVLFKRGTGLKRDGSSIKP